MVNQAPGHEVDDCAPALKHAVHGHEAGTEQLAPLAIGDVVGVAQSAKKQ